MDTHQLRMEALSQSVRVSLASGGVERPEATVARADEFHAFLLKPSYPAAS
jgi:hypothetical protein